MRASSYAASSNPIVKSTHFPPGSRSGQRCEDSPRALSSVVSGVGLPPLPETRESPAVSGPAKTMVPSGAHTPTARIAASVRHQQHRTAADRHFRELAVREEADPRPVGGEKRLACAFGSCQGAHRRIGQIADVELLRPALDGFEHDVGPARVDGKRRRELVGQGQSRR